jgi:uncharacterized membrane protein
MYGQSIGLIEALGSDAEHFLREAAWQRLHAMGH